MPQDRASRHHPPTANDPRRRPHALDQSDLHDLLHRSPGTSRLRFTSGHRSSYDLRFLRELCGASGDANGGRDPCAELRQSDDRAGAARDRAERSFPVGFGGSWRYLGN